jgi:hypothetical protein
MNFDRLGVTASRDTGNSRDVETRLQEWLLAQCAQVPDARAGLVLESRGGHLVPAALWPSAAAVGILLELGERAGQAAKGLVTGFPAAAGGDPNYGIAYPVRRDGMVVAVAALAVRLPDEAALQPAMRQLQWGAAGLELILSRQTSEEEHARVETLESSIDLLSALLTESRFGGAAMALVTGLATRLDADRVSLGLIEKGECKVRHMSHTSQFGERMNLVRLIEAAMDEAVDQRLSILLPAPEVGDGAESGPVRLAHDALVALEPGVVMTLPLYVAGEPAGALTVERPSGRPFSDHERRAVESQGALAIAVLEEKRQNDRPLPAKVWGELRRWAGLVLRPGHAEYRVGLLLVLMLLAAMAFAYGTDNLSAGATLTPQQLRIMAAPFDGYLKSAPMRAGDSVRRGQVLAALDDSDLALERAKWLSQLGRFGGLYQDAVASADRVQANVNSAQRDEVLAQLDLTNSLIARSVLRAPFDGMVVSGDLSQRLGGTVSKGEVLFTVAPAGNYRVDLDVKESRIAALKVGQAGVLYLSALPARAYRFTVRKVTPKTVAQNGATYFVVEGELDPGQVLADLRPGMEGVGKIDVGRGWLPAIWTRGLTEWIRLKLWGLFG